MNSLTPEVISRSIGQVGSTILFIILGAATLEIGLYIILGKIFKSRYTRPFMLLAPAARGLALLVVYPIGYEVRLVFSIMSLRHFKNPGFGLDQAWKNFP